LYRAKVLREGGFIIMKVSSRILFQRGKGDSIARLHQLRPRNAETKHYMDDMRWSSTVGMQGPMSFPRKEIIYYNSIMRTIAGTAIIFKTPEPW